MVATETETYTVSKQLIHILPECLLCSKQTVLAAIGLVNGAVNGCQKVAPQPIGFFHNSKPMVVQFAHLAKLAKLAQMA